MLRWLIKHTPATYTDEALYAAVRSDKLRGLRWIVSHAALHARAVRVRLTLDHFRSACYYSHTNMALWMVEQRVLTCSPADVGMLVDLVVTKAGRCKWLHLKRLIALHKMEPAAEWLSTTMQVALRGSSDRRLCVFRSLKQFQFLCHEGGFSFLDRVHMDDDTRIRPRQYKLWEWLTTQRASCPPTFYAAMLRKWRGYLPKLDCTIHLLLQKEAKLRECQKIRFRVRRLLARIDAWRKY